LQLVVDVTAPVEVEIDLDRSSRSFGFDTRNSRNAIHRLFNRTRDGDECLRCRRFAVVDDDDDARKISLWEDCDWKLPCRVDSGSAEQRHDDHDSARLV